MGTPPSACRTSRESNAVRPAGDWQVSVKSGFSGFALISETMVPARSPRGRQSMLSPRRVAVKTVPRPTSLSMAISPPVSRAFCAMRGIPSPTLRVVRVVAKGLTTRARSSSLMPHPSSRMRRVMSLSASTETEISTSDAPARTLFCARSRICSDRSRIGLSPYIWPECRGCRRARDGRRLLR